MNPQILRKTPKIKVAIACGGTGGHIFPGIATGEALAARGHEVTLWLTGRGVEGTAAADWHGPVVTASAEGFPVGFSLRAFRSGWKLLRAVVRCRREMRLNRPDVVLAMGSYAAAAPCIAAFMLRIPVVLHEANVLPGRANALLSRWATAVAGSFEATRFYMRRKEITLTGMPLRKRLKPGRGYPFPEGLQDGHFTLLVMGGSQGARRLNDTVAEAVCRVRANGTDIQIIHLTGPADEAEVARVYQAANVAHAVHAFLRDMGPVFSAADLAVCRAGAATCAELSLFGVPALLVPHPYGMDHQMANARALEKKNAADVVAEKDMSVQWLVEYITRSIGSPGRLAEMSAASMERAGKGGAEALADLVVHVAGQDPIRKGVRHPKLQVH